MSFFKVEGITKRFGGLTAVNDISFEVERGEIFTIIGPNGSGKSTMFNLISLIYPLTAGRIVLEGKDIGQLATHRAAALGIGRTFQNIELFEHATVLQNLLVGCHTHTSANLLSEILYLPGLKRREVELRRHVEEVIDFLRLQSVRDTLVAGLPYGVRKVVELGRALCLKPKLLLLDEPSSGLNVEETEEMAFWIHDIRDNLDVTVLLVEHDMALVSRVSDRVLAVNEGKLLALGTPAEVQSDPAVMTAYLGE
ncbi:ABC transporter ATP-binding protein [Ramlibacter sp.]|uniref:ABC transporter ATP-binding protein n=1 Tax=Ramlibacter sp. TaxID=1917967 RepID=UPI003D146664